MSNYEFKITINFLSYWFISSGVENGAYADQITLKDRDGFPYVPGKSIKGVFREAFRTALKSGWFDRFRHDDSMSDEEFHDKLIQLIFGQNGTVDGYSRDELHAEGLIHFTNAEIAGNARSKIGKENSFYLFKTVQSTKINKETGTAENKSLRTIEVAVPMHLSANVSVTNPFMENTLGITEKEMSDILALFDSVSSLITEMGGKRRRGFGRCLCSMEII